MWFLIVLALAKIGGWAIRLINPKRGTDFPGKLALALDRNFAKKFRKLDFEKIILITGSNGKSTTTNLIHHTLTASGRTAASNLRGSNMLNGATTVFIRDTTLTGRPKSEFYVIEVDERSFPEVHDAFPARHVLVTNIMQDQVHRNGEPDFIYQILKKSFNNDMTLYLNNDEPRSKSYEDQSGSPVYFGVAENPASRRGRAFHDVTLPCPKCHSRISFIFRNAANTGAFQCTECSFSTSPTENLVTGVDYGAARFRIGQTLFPMPYSAPVMLYNYAAAYSVARAFGVAPQEISAAFSTFVNVGGRMETLTYGSKRINYIRMKQENPETLQGALDAIAQDRTPKVFVIGLCTLEERRPQWVPHYANTYYAFDCDFGPLLASGVERIICFSEYVCYDIANRLLYDGAPAELMTVLNTDSPDEVIAALDGVGCDNVYLITLMRLMESFKDRLGRIAGASPRKGGESRG